jgi:hypothetical protein
VIRGGHMLLPFMRATLKTGATSKVAATLSRQVLRIRIKQHLKIENLFTIAQADSFPREIRNRNPLISHQQDSLAV